MEKIQFVMVGGFLGAGKTTLLYEATKMLMEQGKNVGLITNDQASELVDTALLLQNQVNVQEVSGSCFCCNYSGLVDSIHQIQKNKNIDFILAEPVGSCTDLSATLMQPLKEKLNRELKISPLTVLIDPVKLADVLEGGNAGLHPSAAYILKKQMEEGDVLVISKSDLVDYHELEFLKENLALRYPGYKIMTMSSKSQSNINEWLEFVSKNTQTGQRIVDVDYDIYAEGEAVLGWLNCSVGLTGEKVNWDNLLGDFLKRLSNQVDASGISVGHIKAFLKNASEYSIGNVTGTNETLVIRGAAGISDEAQLIINARAGVHPDNLNAMVKKALEDAAGHTITLKVNAWKCLSPGYPNPTYRYEKVVGIKGQ